MKRFATILFLAVFSVSCMRWLTKETISDNGNVVIQERTLGNYTKVKNVGNLEVILSKGEVGKIRIEASDNLLPLISTTIEGDNLIIELDDNYNYNINHKAVVYVPVNSSLSEITLAGFSNISLQDRLKVNNLQCNLLGTGNIAINIDANELELSIIGSGDIKAEGNSPTLTASITGSGNINAQNIKSERAKAKISGSGNIMVYTSEEIEAKITGAGNIFIEGNPKKQDTSVLGVGNIDFK
ncbi:DUF2807 domain-containing protein [Capnocytophaga cynodegmi]|uniref:DUF2807 domain-containing protein n=1 Tax=Capnocytophaga cynodegmi TaxID=28189 RepID=A0A250E8T0_9FLAO|nr:head GIN domain-containing protein [Capnocytophaga cynodegmi]ATA68127.1 DUF2807 domain-containing protein [Capnocytophaga cynodegmi]